MYLSIIGCTGGAKEGLSSGRKWLKKPRKEDIMAIFIMLTKLTDEGRRTIKQRPERIKEVNKEVEAMGVKIIGQYSLLGPYDFVNILDAPDSKTISRVAVELGSRGTLETLTMAAMSLDDFITTVLK